MTTAGDTSDDEDLEKSASSSSAAAKGKPLQANHSFQTKHVLRPLLQLWQPGTHIQAMSHQEVQAQVDPAMLSVWGTWAHAEGMLRCVLLARLGSL